MKTVLRSVLITAITLCSSLATAAWEPTFVDNFDGNTLDERSWAYGRENLIRRTHYYDKDAVNVTNGILRLNVLNRAESDRAYTTGAITTQGLFKQRYGYFEMRAKIPRGNGFWPSFWLFPESGRWNSEVDIAELRGHLTSTVHNAFHYDNRLQIQHDEDTDVSIDLSTSFNNYAVRWTPNILEYSLNGQVLHTITDPAVLAEATDEMYVILNLAMSSQYNTGFNPPPTVDTNLAQAFEVDYVRVYRETNTGTFATIPAANQAVANVSPGTAYDNTAASIDHLNSTPDIMRTPGGVGGTVAVTPHKDNYSARMFVFLSRIQSFNTDNGRYEKTAPVETLSFNINAANFGDTQFINYAFTTPISDPSAYVVDVQLRDQSNGNKKDIRAFRVVQYVDSSQPNTTFGAQGFFRPGSANYTGSGVNATLQLQLQEALLLPFMNVHYELVDTNTDEVLATFDETLDHENAGLQTLTPQLTGALDTSRSIGLTVEVSDAADNFNIARYATGVSGTQPPNPAWNPFADSTDPSTRPPIPTPTSGPIPTLDWEPSFVDNFNGDSVLLNAWRPGAGHIPRRMNYYDKDALRVENGILNIDLLNRAESDRGYTTGIITTQGIFKQRYGYFEIRARMPNGQSFWPAFWLFPETGVWTSEIDIAEFRGHLPYAVHNAFHYGNRLRNENSGDPQTAINLSETFNNYAVYWTPDRIDYLINGEIAHSVTDPNTLANAQDEMYVLVDMALASKQNANWIPTITRESNIDQSFEVDYVRVYRQSPNGRYRGIPAADASVPNLIPAAYDDMALSVDRIQASGELDILRQSSSISGSFEVTAHSSNNAARISVFLTQLSNFNSQDGRYAKSPALAAQNIFVNLTNVGDTQVINYNFDNVQPSVPGVYSVDVLVRDTQTGNRFLFDGHRIVQFVNPNQPNTGVFLDAFLRNLTTGYSNGQVTASIDMQLQQSMLVPFYRVAYSVTDSNGDTVAQGQQNYEHQQVGLVSIPLSFAANLGATASHNLNVSVTDSAGNSVGQLTAAIGDGVVAPPPVNPPPPTKPPLPVTPGQNILDGVIVRGTTADINLRLDILDGDTLFYNLKLFDGARLLQKVTGNAGNIFVAGNVTLPVTVSAVAAQEATRAVVFIHRNTWDEQILFGKTPTN